MNIFKIIISLLIALTPQLFADQTIILIRHGLAEHNVKDVYNSNPEHPDYIPSHLTEQGKNKTIETAKLLKEKGLNAQNIPLVYVSPLPRTQETAQLLAKEGLIKEQNVIYDNRLKELQVGNLEGKPIIRPWDKSMNIIYHSETDEEIDTRLKDFLFELPDQSSTKLIVTHGYIAQRIMLITGSPLKKLEPGEAIVLTWKGAPIETLQ